MAQAATKGSDAASPTLDLVVVGGGVNGAGVARDAAGRGLQVLLCEKDDLAEGTSSRSGKYIHGGLRYLEYYEFRLVREALIEREALLAAGPHIMWPLRLVLPHSPEQRPAWLVRLGLFLYDHLGGRKKLPATRVLDLRTAPEGAAIKDDYVKAFEYADVWVDDARLVILNALDAAKRGAEVLTRTKCVGARREGGLWRVTLVDASTGKERTVHARALVNTGGPWVETVLNNVAGVNGRHSVRLVKGSHVIMKKWWDGANGYVLQNDDKRLLFINPYLDGLALVGTTDIPFEGAPEDVAIDGDEIDYLLGVLNRYFKQRFTAEDVVASYSGVRPLYDDDASKGASAVTRDYTFEVDGNGDRAPIVSAFGGKITTYRKLAEHALDRLKPFFPEMKPGWTATAPLPGGDIANADFDAWLEGFAVDYPWLPANLARHYGRLYGTRAYDLLRDAKGMRDLGQHFGGRLYEREARFLVAEEWALTADDILERRTKHGLFMTREARAALSAWIERQAAPAALRTA